ncbi:facilitated trehalose transporter Tret1-2 homolog isoform X1 [Schistocerca nitens]|uniref:facilitated trehalose transporter Tret1-2 homolog isoform X1 n=1 Tax=Schistocerca nitens TaxID=7011 RepID=UPI002118C5FE|nr:facilitated trehalose transporter Tret1-2 homolog isoform X1 [Schistocerca nitens]
MRSLWRRWPCGLRAGGEPSEKHAILDPYACRPAPPQHDYTNQLLLAMAASLGYLTVGLVRGFSSPGVPSMQQTTPWLVPDDDAVSWVSSVPPLGAFVGSLASGPLLQRLGRKRTLMISAPLFVAFWVLLAFSQNYAMLFSARILTGFCAGISIPSAQVYVNESAHARVRGVLGSLPALFMSGGILLAYVLGAWLPWQALAGACAVPPALLFLSLLPLPESPVWLADRGRHADAARAMAWLHRDSVFGGDPAASPEPPMALRAVKSDGGGVSSGVFTLSDDTPPPYNGTQQEAAAPEKEKEKETASSKGASAAQEGSPFSRRALLRRPVLIPLALSLALLVFQQLSGIDSVVFYTVMIFESAGSTLDDHVATIIVGAVQLLANVAALFVVDRAGRRPLLLASGALMAVSMAALGAYFNLQEQNREEGLELLPLASLVVFMLGYSLGYCTLPFLLMGELLPERQRGPLSSLAGSFNLAFMFVVIKTFHNFQQLLGNDGTFWLYGAMCLASCAFVWLLVPETRAKSLAEIEQFFEDSNQARKEKRAAAARAVVVAAGGADVAGGAPEKTAQPAGSS